MTSLTPPVPYMDDAPNLVPRKQDRQHSGLLDGYGKPYPLLKEALAECAGGMYLLAASRR